MQPVEGLCRWRAPASEIFEGLLVDCVGETGDGRSSSPSVRAYLRRCGLALADEAVGRSGEADGERWRRVGYRDSDDSDDGTGIVGGGRRETRGWHTAPGKGDWMASSSSSSSSPGDDDRGEDEEQRGGGGGGGFEEEHGYEDDRPETGAGTAVDELGRDDPAGSDAPGASSRPPTFLRTGVYFGELLALGRVLRALRHVGRSGPATAINRGRRQSVSYCLTLLRAACGGEGGGLERDEPPSWSAGLLGPDEDLPTLQRAQLLADARLHEKLLPFLHDADADVRESATACALVALRGGRERLRWTPLPLPPGRGECPDPRAVLSLGFCAPAWVSGLLAIISRGRWRRVPADFGAAGRSARGADDRSRLAALRCLGCMADAGEIATGAWAGLGVVSALQGELSRPADRGDAVSPSPGDASRGAETPAWKNAALGVLRSLAENGSVEAGAVIRAHPALAKALSVPGGGLLDASGPEDLAAAALSLLPGGTLGEVTQLVRRVRSTLAATVRGGGGRFLGGDAGGDAVPDDALAVMSLVWGWMQRAAVQLARDDAEHPLSPRRAELALECLGLLRFLLLSGAPAAPLLVGCRIHERLAAEASRAAGAPSGAPEDKGGPEYSMGHDAGRRTRGGARADLARARTGLELAVRLMSSEDPAPRGPHPSSMLSALSVAATDAVADAVAYAGEDVVDRLCKCDPGSRLALAVENSARLARESRRPGPRTSRPWRAHPAGRRARRKLLDRMLRSSRGELVEQIVGSGLCELVVRTMLADCGAAEASGAGAPAGSAPADRGPLVRDEGIALLEAVVERRQRCPGVAGEMARQAVRHDLPSAEMSRLRAHRRLRSVRRGVGACLRALARLGNPSVDKALVLAGVPPRAVVAARREPLADRTRARWSRWLQRAAEAEVAAPLSGGACTPHGEASPFPSPSAPPAAPPRVSGGGAAGPGNGGPPGLGGIRRSGHSPEARPSGNKTASGGTYTFEGVVPVRAASGKGVPASPPGRGSTVGAPLEARSSSGGATIRDETDTSPRGSRGAGAGDEGRVATLVVEGDAKTLSLATFVELLAFELGAAREDLRVLRVGDSPEDSLAAAPSSSSPSSSAPGSTEKPALGRKTSSASASSTLKILVGKPLADQLYTRCLAGVLRVPGLLTLEVGSALCAAAATAAAAAAAVAAA